jgi:AcrR family transcriptional regulator
MVVAEHHDLTEQRDGRRLRRDRNRIVVIDAMLELVAEGNLRPGAAEIADRSGVSLRSVFRYFDHLDELLGIAVRRQMDRIGHLLVEPAPASGTRERIEAMLDVRLPIYEAMAPISRAAWSRAPFEPTVNRAIVAWRNFGVRWLQEYFAPEIGLLCPDRRRSAEMGLASLLGFENLDLLNDKLGLSLDQVKLVLTDNVEALLRP